MPIEANFLSVSLKGSSQSLVGNGLRVAQMVDADGLGYVDFRVDGTALGWDYDGGTTDRVELQSSTGDMVSLTRVGDYFRWTVTPDDLRTAATAPGSTTTATCQIVVTRTTAGSTVSNAPGRWTSREFTVTVDRKVGFSPDIIAGLALWLDAYDITEAAGVDVASWDDKSIYDRDAAEVTNKPTRQTDGTGRPHLLFNGTNDILTTAWTQFGDPTTVFIAAQMDSYDATLRGLVQVGGVGGVRIACDSTNLKGATGTDIAATTLPALDTTFVATATKAAGGAVTIQYNLVAAVTQASAQAVTDGAVTIGDTLTDAAAACRIYEIIVFDTVLSAENIARCVRYLRSKWGAA